MDFDILVVDDEVEVCRSLCEILTAHGYRARYETESVKVIARAENERVDLMLMDLRMPEIGGIDLLRQLRKKWPDLAVIIFSGYATVENAVRAMKYGALNLYTKPIKISLLLKEIEQIRESIQRKHTVSDEDDIVTVDPYMKNILSIVETAAPTNASVLITGESGTGKELIANTFHARSKRHAEPFIKINCASIPETLMESEIFGHEAGAYTDAKERKKGLFELASGGSLFLDEIGDMSLGMQAKMLRVLQDGKFMRVGGTKPIGADCRIITATNRNLEESIKTGSFREDLFYRLSVINIHVPPLRERTDDILPLATYFLSHFAAMYDKKTQGISPEVQAVLSAHNWPGNIRELKNFMERAVIFTKGSTVEIGAIPDQYRNIAPKETAGDLYDRMDGAARDIIVDALSKTNGVKQEAARLLRIDRKTLYNRMKKFDLP
ncbi:MAG: sigma-54 dependent transcriptional regulator [Treponemataceae bacterium]